MIEFDQKDIKKIRTIKVFIDAASQIIEEEGIENVTIRKVAKIAGYNSATIYNYFDNCNQLIFFAATKFLKDYVQAMPDYIDQGDNELEQLILMWECFCLHSFRKPKIYYAIFADDIGGRPGTLIKNYYQLFPEDLGSPPEELIPMLVETRLSRRTSISMKPVLEAGFFSKEIASEIDEEIRLVYHGMLSLIINKRIDCEPEEATAKVMNHIRRIFAYAVEQDNKDNLEKTPV